ncbi:Cuticle protein 6-like 12, partial [Homarus americanus]
VVVVVAVAACTLYSPEARPAQTTFSRFPARNTVRLQNLSQRTQQDLNRVWDTQLEKQRSKSQNQDDTISFFERPGDGRYVYGYDVANDGPSHMEASDGNGKTVGKYSYTDATGKNVEVHYVSGAQGFRVISNNLPEDTEDVKRAKEVFFKAFEERKATHSQTPSRDTAAASGVIGASVVPVAMAYTSSAARAAPATTSGNEAEGDAEEGEGDEEEEGEGDEEEGEEEDDEGGEDEDEEDSEEEEDSDEDSDSSSSSEEDSSSSSEEDSSSSSEEDSDEEDSDEEDSSTKTLDENCTPRPSTSPARPSASDHNNITI